MDAADKATFAFILIVVLLLAGLIFGAVFAKTESWEKLDNTGNCYLHVIDDDSAFGEDRETRETYCKESK